MSHEETITDFLASMGPDADPSATWAPELRERTSSTGSLPSFDTEDPGQLGATADLVLGEVLGEGGMGIVFAARQPALDREVAVKRLKAGVSGSASRSLSREARVMGRLDHPNIIPVHALGKDGSGSPVVVMKKVDGVSWRTLVTNKEHAAWERLSDRGSTQRERHLSVFLDVCRAVAFAHERDVVHLDLKPDNVMVGEHGEVYVVDWGLAQRLGDRRASIAGSPSYMAPELASAGEPLDARTDVFLLGATLFEALTGVTPRQGPDLAAVLALAREAPPLRWSPDVSPALAAIVDRATARTPVDRHASVHKLVADIRDYLAHVGSERLSAAASLQAARLQELTEQPSPDPVALTTAFSAARFGYEQALAPWPDNPQARSGLTAVLTRMVRWSAASDEVASARGLLAELEDHAGRQAELQELLGAAEVRVSRQRERAHEQDLAVGYTGRMVWLSCFAGFGVLLAMVVYGELFALSHRNLFAMSGMLVVTTTVLTSALWPSMAGNAMSRRIVASINLSLVTMALHRGLVWQSDHPPPVEQVVATDQLLIGFVAVTIAIFAEPYLLLAAAIFLVSGTVAWIEPAWAFASITVSTLAVPPVMVAVLWWRRDAVT